MDFESTLQDEDKNIGEKSHIYQKHVPNSCGIKLNCDNNTYSLPIKIFNNSNPEKLIEDVILDLEKKAKYVSYNMNKNRKNILISDKKKKEHYSKLVCDECKCKFDDKNKKVMHHDHMSGKFISTLCNKCNLSFQVRPFFPVFIHNLKILMDIF